MNAAQTRQPCDEKPVLGIEFGSTRVKAVLIDGQNRPIASGSCTWENRFENGFWTYDLKDVWDALQKCYRSLSDVYMEKYGHPIQDLGAIGFSGMMHGYLAFDRSGELLVPFRTWRNTTTKRAAEELSELFSFNIPQRWSIAHLYQAVLDQEPHTKNIDYLTTLSGYVHWKLTGRRVLGVGEASGMFPIDSETGSYNQAMLDALEQRIAGYGFPWKLKEVLPEVLSAGERAGVLTEEGARLLDPTGSLKAGIPLCPPEGDAGTGMVATNAVRPRTGNVSAGTSIFAMLVLERGLRQAHAEIDMVTTPDGAPVAMVHCNNCTSELNAWAALFHEFAQAAGTDISDEELYPLLFRKAMEGEPTCGGVLSCCYLSGEPISGLESGRPLLVRRPDSRLTLGNFMRSQLFATVAALKTGLDLLFQKESVSIDRLTGHGGLFKTPEVGQRILAAAAGVPVSVMETAGEGGAWGIALLAQYMLRKGHAETLAEYLEQEVFREMSSMEIAPSPEEQSEFTEYMKAYHHLLAVERAAVEQI